MRKMGDTTYMQTRKKIKKGMGYLPVYKMFAKLRM